jgi:hypothetical protein
MWENHLQQFDSRGHRAGKSFRDRGPAFDTRPEQTGSSLDQIVARMKARWLQRVMYESAASSSQKCFAYAVFDHLNCVTLDCWPSQERLAKLLGFASVKSIQRASRGLEELMLLKIHCGSRDGYRYAPVFAASDEDKPVRHKGLICPASADRIVRESFLSTQLTGPASTAAEDSRFGDGVGYQMRQRGALELLIAERLGPNGMEVLAKLSAIDDLIVERMCRAQSAGQLGERELNAARLAAEQARL